MKLNKSIEDIYGPQSPGDSAFTAKARLLQSVYRVQNGEMGIGIGPTRNSIGKDQKPTYYGNMLSDGEISGKNFFFNETFEYAQKRIKNKLPDETISEYRLFNNLLSSMPLAFNLFHPLMMIKEKYPDFLIRMIRDAFPSLPIHQVDEITIEFIPSPKEQYTNDKSAMDAAIFFSDETGNRYVIAIETKYTDCLGSNLAKENELKIQTALKSGLFTNDGIAHINKGCTQVYRNFLLTEKYRMVHQLKDSYSIILAPKDHPSTDSEIQSMLKFLKPEYHYKLKKYTLEDLVSSLGKNCPDEFQAWLEWFYDRYLDFNKVESILNEPPLS